MVFLEVRGYFFTKNSRFWEFSLRNFRLGILEFHIEILGSSRGMSQGLGILEFLRKYYQSYNLIYPKKRRFHLVLCELA